MSRHCPPTLPVLLALLAPAAGAAAQEDASAATAVDHRALLRRACAKMASLPGVAFKTVEAQDSAMMRQLRGQIPGGMNEDTEVTGHWCHGVTQAQLNFDEDEIIRHGDRMLARGRGGWKLRRDTLAGGAPLPFVLDPKLLFEVLARVPGDQMEVRNQEAARFRDTDVVILGVTFEGEVANDLHLSGIFPRASEGGGFVMRHMRGMLGGGGDDVTVDMAFYVEPQSGLVHRLRVKAYKQSAMAGTIRVAVGGGGEMEEPEPEEPVQERDEQGNRIYKRGLPVRALGDDLSLSDFDVTFSQHGKTFAVDLDDDLRILLDLPNRR